MLSMFQWGWFFLDDEDDDGFSVYRLKLFLFKGFGLMLLAGVGSLRVESGVARLKTAAVEK